MSSLFVTPEQRIEAARRIDLFFKDDVIAAVMGKMERAIYEELLVANSSEDRVRVWAKSVTLRNFKKEMQIVLDRGEEDVIALAKAEAKRQQKP